MQSQNEFNESSVNIQSFLLFLFASIIGLLIAILILPFVLPNMAFSLSGDAPKAYGYLSRHLQRNRHQYELGTELLLVLCRQPALLVLRQNRQHSDRCVVPHQKNCSGFTPYAGIKKGCQG